MISKSKRIGRFSVPLDLVRDGHVGVKRIMSQCIIVRAEVMFINNCIEYDAISWRFREVDEGECVPLYKLTWSGATYELSVEEVQP